MAAKKAPQQRASRAQETRESEELHEEYADNWDQPGLLNAPEARPGFAQRWVRTKLGGTDDQGNLIRKLNQGWRPRQADTVPKGYAAPTTSYGDYGNVVGTHDMLLMERPSELNDKYVNRIKEDTRNLEHSVKRTLGQVHKPGSGLTSPSIEENRQVSTGRRVNVADD
jgi:hypothetical protein